MPECSGNVLIVDDEPNAVKGLCAMLSGDGYNVFESRSVQAALEIIEARPMDAIITDWKMPGVDGMQLFESVMRSHPDVPVIFLTAYGTVESAVHSVSRGAYYYFIKPPDFTKLRGVLRRAVSMRRACLESGPGDAQAAAAPAYGGIGAESGRRPSRFIGQDPALRKIQETIRAVADSRSSVLITGETGTGKELVARAVHYGSARRDKPFVTVNCAAIPRELLEAELFGYEKGAFTNAVSRRIGKFEEAASGSVFLDEIAELELPLQAKLLRVLQEREIERLGGGRKIRVDFRLVCSANRDLEKEVQAGNFRMDLYYRINVVHIWVPPLRQRKGDIPLLVEEFVREFSEREKKSVRLAPEVLDAFCDYSWPGNVRQLRNVLEGLTVLSTTGLVTPGDIPEEILAGGGADRWGTIAQGCPEGRQTDTAGPAAELPPQGAQTLREIEKNAVVAALEECRGNKSRAAKLLGISRKTLYKRLKEIEPANSRD